LRSTKNRLSSTDGKQLSRKTLALGDPPFPSYASCDRDRRCRRDPQWCWPPGGQCLSNSRPRRTILVKDIFPGIGELGPNSSYPQQLTNINGTLFFSAADGSHGFELWKSNGTAAGTVMVKDINTKPLVGTGNYGSYPAFLTNVNGVLFFSANDGTHGNELWRSNGTGGRHRHGRGH
jgi:ELWxxDGT repeat protein